MIVIDASVLIAYLNAPDANHTRAETILLDAAVDRFGASSITLAEVMVGPTRAGTLETARAMLRDLEIREVVIAKGTTERLARIRYETGLKLPDCCVLLAAQDADADTVLTFDDRLAKRARDLGYAVWTEPSAGAARPHEPTRPEQ